MASVIVVQSGTQQVEWNNTLCDCCGSPGGCGTCCYVWCCTCCAAGDVAKAAGRDYCMSCCIIPGFVGCIAPCWWTGDRQALTQKLNIRDTYGYFTVCCMFCAGSYCCLPCCLLTQELNHIKANEGKAAASGGGGTIVVSPVPVAMGQPSRV